MLSIHHLYILIARPWLTLQPDYRAVQITGIIASEQQQAIPQQVIIHPAYITIAGPGSRTHARRRAPHQFGNQTTVLFR